MVALVVRTLTSFRAGTRTSSSVSRTLRAFSGITTRIVERKLGPLELGQADGLACRTVEMFEAFGLSERLLKEAYEQSQFLDLIGPAEQRVGAIGRLETAIEKTLAAIDTGEVEFEKGMARYVQLEGMLIKLTGAAMPSRVEVASDPERAVPDMVFLEELRKAKEHAARMAEMEENDGLDE